MTLLILAVLGRVWAVESGPAGTLQAAIERAESGDTLELAAGTFAAIPRPFVESLCGNCRDPRTVVQASVGFLIRGKSLVIRGRSPQQTTLVTRAGYGLLFEDSPSSLLEHLTVTGGTRDPDGNATDAGVVVRRSQLAVRDVAVVDNTSRVDSVVVGIGGVFGREGSDLSVQASVIRNNGWDGIALYRGAQAVIAGNQIEQGRGAGIGITWDASALVHRNRISGYWKGIGTFGDSRAVVRNNVVSGNLGWGVIATGNSFLDAANNVIYRNGNCGFAAWESTARGVLRNNIIARNGWNKEWVCPCVGGWFNTPSGQFVVHSNDFWENTAGNYLGLPDQTGTNGNISQDPLFADTVGFTLKPGSPCIDAGDSTMLDADGSRCDIGLSGGPPVDFGEPGPRLAPRRR